MSAIDSRISKLLPALSARERAILVLKCLHAGEETTEARRVPQDQRHSPATCKSPHQATVKVPTSNET